jgi:hypothetical protein
MMASDGRPIDDLENRFKFHPADASINAQHMLIRGSCRALADMIVKNVPPGREQALAITKIEEAMMWANAGIARAPRPPA